jgi:hypothetical protein
MLKQMLKESMFVAFPLKYKAKKGGAERLLHMQAAFGVAHKACDYFSTTGELIFRNEVKKEDEHGKTFDMHKAFFRRASGKRLLWLADGHGSVAGSHGPNAG